MGHDQHPFTRTDAMVACQLVQPMNELEGRERPPHVMMLGGPEETKAWKRRREIAVETFLKEIDVGLCKVRRVAGMLIDPAFVRLGVLIRRPASSGKRR